jgi:hypothetical protein
MMAEGWLAQLFWRALDRLDYWITQTSLRALDALCGPFPEGDPKRRWW